MMYIPQIGILLFFLVASNALDPCLERCKEVTEFTVNASLKSEVFLPCYFETNQNTTNGTERVTWGHKFQISNFIRITGDGNIIFDDPREGRVTVFPILAAGGNFSIIIHDLQVSDLGPYCCEMNSECRRVKITQSAHDPDNKNELNPWIFFAAGAGLFLLLFIAFYLFSTFFKNHVNRSSKSNSVDGVQNEGNQETQNTRSHEQRNQNNRGRSRENATVYENEAHTQNPQRAFRPVPKPSTSQQSNPKPYYVNQAELSIQSNAGQKRKKKKHYQFKNPIYGD